MNWSIKLFRVRGIYVKVHMTFVLILVWAAYRWSSGSGAGFQGALFGVVATLLLFVAVTLHEFGHSFQALKYNIPVKDITLMPMGGLARMEEIPEDPVKELRIALAGPLVNFILFGLLVALGAVLSMRAVISIPELFRSLGETNWSGMLAYLTMANLALGVFNLIPAFPMDGGRVFRALLAMKLDYSKATTIAVRVGQGLAWLLGLWGFLSGSYTLILIAVVVWMGASGEGRETDARSVLGEIKVRQAMTRSPEILTAKDTLSRAVDLTLSSSQSDFPVVELGGEEVVGLLTEKDLLNGLKSKGESAAVGEVMQRRFATAMPEDPLYEVQRRMATAKTKTVPVINPSGQLLGLLTSEDINEAYSLFSIRPQLASATQ